MTKKIKATKGLGLYLGGRYLTYNKGDVIDLPEESVKQKLDPDDYEIVEDTIKKQSKKKSEG